MIVIENIGDAGVPEVLTPGDTATQITELLVKPTSGKHTGMLVQAALLTCEDNDVHVTLNEDSAPTAASGTNLGFRMRDGENTVIVGYSQVRNLKVIDRVSGSAGKLKIQPFF